ncbi:hypothetical protein GCM10010517_61170 [Streptosporangium fragile]|uniref:Uncharacterized protein n=1 Tax=Streptosporangium fragile TaxID=46186 RepID=A0ABN3W7R8_9ACTN
MGEAPVPRQGRKATAGRAGHESRHHAADRLRRPGPGEGVVQPQPPHDLGALGLQDARPGEESGIIRAHGGTLLSLTAPCAAAMM